MNQLSLFDIGKTPLMINKPLVLIELFAGIGSQASALERIGIPFESRICESDKYAVKSYNAVHGTDFEVSDITKIHADDIGPFDDDHFYILFYSFPCQDISLAGNKKGFAKGEGTRSGLLWEVERLLNEIDHKPDVLIMENVSQVHSSRNISDFNEWISALEKMGYESKWKDMNAKNYGVPQNRLRTFMVSWLGEHTYEFPQEIPLKLVMKDMLEDDVEDKYYLSDEVLKDLIINVD